MKLASNYRAADSLPLDESARKTSFQTAYMRWLTTYGNCLKFRTNSQWLLISVGLPFRIGHPPLIVPWDDVTVIRGKGILKHFVELRFRRAPTVPIRVSRILYERLAEMSGSLEKR